MDKKKKPKLEAKIVKHAHRRLFQEYVREKGRDKATIGYVYWNMFLRSGKGNVFELEEGMFLADLGIGKNSLRPARKTLYDDGWLSKESQKINPLTGKWGTTAWTVNIAPVAHSKGDGTDAHLMGDHSTGDCLTGDRSVGDTVVLHLLGALENQNPNASTFPVPQKQGSTSAASTDQSINQSASSVESLELKAAVTQPVADEAEERTNPKSTPEDTDDFAVATPYGSTYNRANVWLFMADCWPAFKNSATPSVEEFRLFAEVLVKCNENTCYPSQLTDWAQTHILNPKLLGALRSVKGLHKAVCGEGVSSTNGLLAQFKDHSHNPKACGICLKKTQGVNCAIPGCKNWVELGYNGEPTKYCAQCAKLDHSGSTFADFCAECGWEKRDCICAPKAKAAHGGFSHEDAE